MTALLSSQMFALLDAIVTGNGAEAFEPFAPQNTVAALVRRGLLMEEQLTRENAETAFERMTVVSGFTRLVATDAGRKAVAAAEAAYERPDDHTSQRGG